MLTRVPTPKEFRPLDEIVTDNARLWLRRRVAAERVMRKTYSLEQLAEEMLGHVDLEPDTKEYGGRIVAKVDTVGRAVERFLGLSRRGKMPWRLDYLDAFAKAMGISINVLMDPESKLGEEELALLEGVSQYAPWLIPHSDKKSRIGA